MNCRGNRFNLLFYNAAGTYFLAPFLIDYIQNSKTTLNFTVNYIFKALQNDHVLAICRALGIISKIITQPYYERSADENTTALSMGNVYNRLINILALSTENPDLLLTNQTSLFFGPFLPPSPVSQSLFKPCHLDIHTRNILTCLCSSLKSKCESLFKEFLDGGKYYEPSDQLIEITKSCLPNWQN